MDVGESVEQQELFALVKSSEYCESWMLKPNCMIH